MDTYANCIPKFKSLSKLQSLQLLERSRANPTLSDGDRQELVAVVSDATDELTLYDHTIAQLHDLIWRLEHERQNLQSHVGLTRSLLAPIRKLPVDLLSEMFLHHGHDNVICSGWAPSTKHYIPAFSLTSVCSLWRRTALSTPRLWGNINLAIGNTIRKHAGTLVDFLLEHSRNADLDVTVYLGHEPEEGDAPFIRLCQHSSRWHALHATVDSPSDAQERLWTILSSVRGSIGRLKELELDVEDLVPLSCQDIFQIAPCLARIHLIPPELKLPAEQITYADFSLSRTYWCTQMSRLSGLKSAVVRMLDDEKGEEEEALATCSSHLQTLSIRMPFGDLSDFKSLFQCAFFPDLHTILIRGNAYERFNLPILDFNSFLQRSSCTITTLCITNITTCPTLFDLLSMLPTITNFVLHVLRDNVEESEKEDSGDEASDLDGDREKLDNRKLIICRILEAMTVKSTPSFACTTKVLLPLLTSLDIHCSGSKVLKDQPLLNMVLSRWRPSQQGISALKSFEFHRADQPFGPEFIQTMLRLKRCGLLISVRDSLGDIELR